MSIATTIVREFPEAQVPFLRFQAGVEEQRPELQARYLNAEGKNDPKLIKPNSFTPTGKKVTVFRLLGFGQTKRHAIDMATNARLQ
jgi:hypothetical protein